MLVLLDRDGVINHDRLDSVKSIAEWELIPHAPSAIAMLKQAGFKVAVITNQSIVGRGVISMPELDAIHNHMQHQLAEQGAAVDAIYVCPDAPDAPTIRRKPSPGMVHEALRDFEAEAAQTPMIGDALTDLQAAANAGCPRYLVLTGKGVSVRDAGIPSELLPVRITAHIGEAAQQIVSNHKRAA